MRGRREDITVQQQEDIAAVGSLMVRLAGAAAGGPALQALAGHLSPHLMHLLASLQNSHIRDCHMVKPAVFAMVWGRFPAKGQSSGVSNSLKHMLFWLSACAAISVLWRCNCWCLRTVCCKIWLPTGQHGNMSCKAHVCRHVTDCNHKGHAVQPLGLGKQGKVVFVCAAAV